MKNRILNKKSLRQLFSFILLASIGAGALPAAAQKKAPAAAKKKAPATGGWSGVITFTKTLNETVDEGRKKNISRGTTHNKFSRDYKYAGRIVVDGSKNANVFETKTQLTLRDEETSWKRYEQFEDCGGDGVDKPQMQWSETRNKVVTNAFSDAAAQFNLWVNELSDTYSFSFRFPAAAGTEDRADKLTKGGWCTAKLNEGSDRTAKNPTTVSGEQAAIEDGKIDPRTPEVLSGSRTWDSSSADVKSFVYTVSWTFKRNPAPVEVTDIRFDERFYPDDKTWKDIETVRGTVDGNRVRIRATVTNFSNETRFPEIKFNEEIENWVLPDGETSMRLEPGESREVELLWDTSGYAWRGKGYDAESYRRIKVEAVDGARTAQLTKLIFVRPRPVVLVHGLWSNAAVWAGYDKFFEMGHSAAWKSYAVGANPSVAKMNTGETFGSTAQTKTIAQNAAELRRQIEFARKELNAWHVDLVAHSMGGLISRYYIANEMPLNPFSRKPVVTKLIMLGTPNQGSPCADLMYRALSATGSRVWALYELLPGVVERFNRVYPNGKGVRFSSLVGWRVPQTCQSPAKGDGVVSIGSGRWMIKDWQYSNSLAHTDLTSRADFGAFVFPRLSTGPRGNHDPEFVGSGNSTRRERFDAVFQNAVFKTSPTASRADDPLPDDAPLEGLTLAKEIFLAANQTTEIEIPVKNGSRAVIVFAAAAQVSATLFDANGAKLGESAAGTPEAKQMFRTIAVEKPVTDGVWKLRLENKAAETGVILAAFTDPDPLALELTVGKPNAAGQISLQAKLTNSGVPVAGAVVKAVVQSADGKVFETDLSGGGVYGANLEKLADGDYLIEVVAEADGRTRRATAPLSVGAAQKGATPTKKTRR